jgi:hypothetical protein
MTRSLNTASATVAGMGLILAAFVGYESTHPAAISQAQFELQVEEGLGSFDRVPAKWAMLHQY